MSGRPELNSWPSQTKDFKLVVEALLSNSRHIKGRSMQKLVDSLPGISYDCAFGVIFQWDSTIKWLLYMAYVTSRHHPDITWNVLKGTFKPNTKKHISNNICMIFLHILLNLDYICIDIFYKVLRKKNSLNIQILDKIFTQLWKRWHMVKIVLYIFTCHIIIWVHVFCCFQK